MKIRGRGVWRERVGGTKRCTGEKGEREGQVERMVAGGGVLEGEG